MNSEKQHHHLSFWNLSVQVRNIEDMHVVEHYLIVSIVGVYPTGDVAVGGICILYVFLYG